MKKKLLYCLLTVACCMAMQSCLFGNTNDIVYTREIRIEIINTNVIGIAGEASTEPYIEIRYSVADEGNPGFNKTASIMVSPPYIFQNDAVNMTYEYTESGFEHVGRPDRYSKKLIHDYTEGGAEYLRIVNHSPDKPVEFFIAGAKVYPYISLLDGHVPEVKHKGVSVYYLLFPEAESDAVWGVDEVAALYRLEYERSSEVQLTISLDDYRMIDLINGEIDFIWQYRGAVFYGMLQSGEALHGDNRIWLLATTDMFFDEFLSGPLE